MNLQPTSLSSMAVPLIASALLSKNIPSRCQKPWPEKLDPFLGRYLANFAAFRDVDYGVVEKRAHLAVDIPGQMIHPLRPPNREGKMGFVFSDDAQVSFQRDQSGKVVSMMFYQAGFEFELPRVGVVSDPQIQLSELEPYCGNYRLKSSETMVEILIQNQRLALHVPGQMIYELHAPDAEGWRSFRVLPHTHRIRFERSGEGTIARLCLVQGKQRLILERKQNGPPAPLPSVDEILAQANIAYHSQALKPRRRIEMTGILRHPNQGITAQWSALLLGPERFKQRLDYGAFGWMELILQAAYALTSTNLNPLARLPQQAFQQARLEHPLRFHADWRRLFSVIKVLRREKFMGRPVHVVKVQNPPSPSRNLFVDVEQGMVLCEDFVELGEDAGIFIPVTRTFDDFRMAIGLRLPFHIVTQNQFIGQTILELETVKDQIAI